MRTIQVHHFHAQYTVARSSDTPAALQRRLDDIANTLLAPALERQFATESEEQEPVCFIQQLNVNLVLDPLRGDDRQLAKIWADSILQCLTSTLNQGGEGAIVFRDRAAFLASFLEDLAQGRAWDYWYYQEFDSLRSITLGQAAVTVLTADSDIGRDALLELAYRNSLERLLVLLTDAEVEAIANPCLLPPSPRVMTPNAITTWIEQVRFLLDSGFSLTFNPCCDLTRMYLGLLRHHPELGPDVNLACFIRALLHLRQAIAQSEHRTSLLADLDADRWANLFQRLGSRQARQLLSTLMGTVPGAEVKGLLQSLQVGTSPAISQRILTPYGGIFLLVGAIADLEMYQFLEQCPYPDAEPIPKANLLLWLMALQCMGQTNLDRTRGDRGLACFAGLDQLPKPACLENYAASLTPALHAAFTAGFENHRQTLLDRQNLWLYQRSLSALPAVPSDWYSLHQGSAPLLSDAAWNDALASLSAIILQGFAARLGAFADSSPDYLSQNFLESQAEIRVSEREIQVHFLTCPLQMVLRMAGFDRNTWEVPWLERRQLSFEFE